MLLMNLSRVFIYTLRGILPKACLICISVQQDYYYYYYLRMTLNVLQNSSLFPLRCSEKS